jgi:tripartite-type tricarboxylate transporter receptor subunit TctC
MSMHHRRSLLVAIAALLAALSAPAAAQSDYPNRPIRLIVPFPAGGSNDIVGRAITTQMSERLGKQIGSATRKMSTEEFGKFIVSEMNKWERVVKESGIKAE